MGHAVVCNWEAGEGPVEKATFESRLGGGKGLSQSRCLQQDCSRQETA